MASGCLDKTSGTLCEIHVAVKVFHILLLLLVNVGNLSISNKMLSRDGGFLCKVIR